MRYKKTTKIKWSVYNWIGCNTLKVWQLKNVLVIFEYYN